MPKYFSLFIFILYPLLFEKVFNEYEKTIIKPLCIIGYILYALYYMVSQGMSYGSIILNIFA